MCGCIGVGIGTVSSVVFFIGIEFQKYYKIDVLIARLSVFVGERRRAAAGDLTGSSGGTFCALVVFVEKDLDIAQERKSLLF